MSCNPLAVVLESPVAATHAVEAASATLYTSETGPKATGYVIDNPCCIFGSLQILYGMPYLTGSGIITGSTV